MFYGGDNLMSKKKMCQVNLLFRNRTIMVEIQERKYMSQQTDSKTVPTSYKNDPRIEKDADGTWHVHGYNEARELLKEDLIQDGFNAEALRKAGFEGVLYMSGEPHRQMRAAIAKYFSPATVQNTHMATIEKTADELIGRLKSQKRINLKILSRDMATVIATAFGWTQPNQRLDPSP